MPNHIQNRLQFIGDKSEVEKVMNHIKGKYDDGEEMQIDFNKIKPSPKGMDIDSDGWLMPLDNKYSSHEEMKAHLNKLRDFIQANPERKEETMKNFLQGVANFIEHGHATWYTWNIENWGTKWNAYQQGDKRNNEDTIYFQTAWSSPVNLIGELSDQFPNVTFKLAYADEDSGCNCGKYTISKGEAIETNIPTNCSNEAYELFFELHPDRKEDYHLVDGKYQCIED